MPLLDSRAVKTDRKVEDLQQKAMWLLASALETDNHSLPTANKKTRKRLGSWVC